MASVRDRGSSWQVRHAGRSRSFPYHNKEQRKQAKRDATMWAFEEERREANGIYYEAPPQRFGDLIDAHLDRARKSGLRPKTIENMEQEAKHLQPLRTLLTVSVRAATVEDLILNIGPSRTAARVLALCKTILRGARSRGMVIDEAALDLKAPKYESREARFLTLKELYELSSWMPEWIRRIVTVAGLTGLRQGELFDLEVTDLDLEPTMRCDRCKGEGRLPERDVKGAAEPQTQIVSGGSAERSVTRSASRCPQCRGKGVLPDPSQGPKLYVRKGKTKAATRTVHLSAEAKSLLKQQLMARPHSNYVFPTRTGLRHEKSRFMERYYRPACIASGLGDRDEQGHYTGLQFHDLRKTYASLMILAGVDVRTIAAEMGHVDGGALLLRRYAHLFDGAGERAAAKLDALMEAR